MPVELRCRCGQVLSVPDEMVGRTITCPECKAAVFVQRPSARPQRASGRMPQQSPPAPIRSQDERCPHCNSILMPGAVLCPICGLDLRTGRVLLREFCERRRVTPGAILGPLGAIAIVALAVWLWRSGTLWSLAGKTPPRREETRTPDSEANARAPQQLPGPTNAGGSAARAAGPVPASDALAGGAISGTVTVADTGRPRLVTARVSIPRGATLKIGKGVSLVGRGEAILSVDGGALVIEGTSAEPTLVAMPVVAPGPDAEFRAQGALFSREVALSGLANCFVERSTFMAGLGLEPRPPARLAEWTFERCELCEAPAGAAEAGAPRACLEVRSTVPAERLRIVVRRSNILGRVSGELGAGAALEIVRSHWRLGPNEALSGLARVGEVSVEPIALAEVEGAGASDILKPQDVLARAGLPAPSGPRGNTIAFPLLGLEVDCPAGWTPTGEGMLIAPARFPRARIQIELRAGDPQPVRVRVRMISELRAGGVEDLRATEGEVLALGEREAFDFTCSFRSEDARWARRCLVVSAGRDAYVFTLSARESDLPELAQALLAVARSMRIVGRRQSSAEVFQGRTAAARGRGNKTASRAATQRDRSLSCGAAAAAAAFVLRPPSDDEARVPSARPT